MKGDNSKSFSLNPCPFNITQTYRLSPFGLAFWLHGILKTKTHDDFYRVLKKKGQLLYTVLDTEQTRDGVLLVVFQVPTRADFHAWRHRLFMTLNRLILLALRECTH
jgi:hypothetical protein